MGLNSLLDAVGPRVEAQIMRDLAADLDIDDPDRRRLLRAARKLEKAAKSSPASAPEQQWSASPGAEGRWT